MSSEPFFDESKEQSQVKAQIVSKYFWAWANVVIPTAKKGDNKIAYIDLFAGPGRYKKEASKSTPLLILEKAILDNNMREMLVTIFNDKNPDFVKSLQSDVKSLAGIEKLKYEPDFSNEEVGANIVKMFEEMSLIPTLFFVDPWGYKGLSLRLINSVLKNWGCDCIFFFNYNRINMGLNNDAVKQHMDALFGEELAEKLREELKPMESAERELAILEAISQALQGMGGEFVLPFCFKNEAGSRTSHHLIFVSKNFKGYEIMKEIMAKESSETHQGVSSFEYNQATSKQPLLFELSLPLDDLEGMLLKEYAGCQMNMWDIYRQHNVGKRYIKRNYKDVLAKLEENGKVVAEPPATDLRKRPMRSGKVTFADHVKVIFPKVRKS